MRKLLLSLTMLMAGAMTVGAQTETLSLMSEFAKATWYKTDGSVASSGWVNKLVTNTTPAITIQVTSGKNDFGWSTSNGIRRPWLVAGKSYTITIAEGYSITGYTLTTEATADVSEYTYTTAEGQVATSSNSTVTVEGLENINSILIDLTNHTINGTNGVRITALDITYTTVGESVNFTYSYVFDDEEFTTEEVTSFTDMEFPAPTKMPYGLSATLPSRKITSEDNGATITLDCECSLPFTYADSYENIENWYYLTLNKFNLYNDGTSDEMYASKTEVDANDKAAYAWAFVGNPVDGFKVANKKGGYLNATENGAVIGEEEHTFTLTASEYHQPNGFFMAAEGKERYNRNGASGKIVYWSGADGGSTFNVVLVEPEAKIGDTYYLTFEEAMAAEGDGEVELLVEKSIVLNDNEAYTYGKSLFGEGVNVEYTRTLIAGIWNPIYLPFEVGLNINEYEVAEFTSAEGTTVTLTKLPAVNEGGDLTLKPNTAYVVRAKEGADLTLSIGCMGSLESNVETVQVLGDFSVRGNYSVLKGENLGANDRIVSKDGQWAPLAGTSTLKPFRLILTIPAGVDASAISMRVEDEDTTSIETLETMTEVTIYDLMGRRVETMTEGGIYIVNGKKVIR